MKYLALLRGINVGGKNIVKMPDLRACFERLSLNNVTTYIQSGNVLFDTGFRNPGTLSNVIEEAVTAEFGWTSLVVIVPEKQIERVVKLAPPGFGAHPAQCRYDVVFIKRPLRARHILPTISLHDEVDEACEGNGVLYFTRLKEKSTQSHLRRLINNPAYRSMTIRNWNTTTELYRLMNRR
ncbi:MAG TPA: DUF1697 domain-containing protein [Bryobacteraceae bacterium]|nr:DUF1697 domain-containing protein [Bryobacteraceae bacterium]